MTKDQYVAFRCNRYERREIEQLASDRKTTISDVIRQAVKAETRRDQTKQKGEHVDEEA